MLTVEEVVREQLAQVRPYIKRSGLWRFAGRDRRGWLVFEPEDSPVDLLAWGGDVVKRMGISRVAVMPIYFWWGERPHGVEFMEVTY